MQGNQKTTKEMHEYGIYHTKVFYHLNKPNKSREVFECNIELDRRSINKGLLPGLDLTNQCAGIPTMFRENKVAFKKIIILLFWWKRFYKVICDVDGRYWICISRYLLQWNTKVCCNSFGEKMPTSRRNQWSIKYQSTYWEVCYQEPPVTKLLKDSHKKQRKVRKRSCRKTLKNNFYVDGLLSLWKMKMYQYSW